ncbi:MAG: 30S ribosomal protein S8 [Candidatus Methylacidiphilales bacterium]|nr:30S ribosomal protein S8 [Candidatus Methylacidiphilales bacterium]
MQTDPLGDFLSSIRNASRAGKAEVVVNYSRLKADVAHILKKEGYLAEVSADLGQKKPVLTVAIRGRGKSRAITAIKRVSKPGLRRYVGSDEIPSVLGGLGVSVVSTPQGVMAGHTARKLRLGGELLCTIY